MDDMISRKAAIDELVRWGRIPDYNDGEKIVIGAAIGMISSLPSVQPKPDWNELLVICDNCGHAIRVKRVEGE